jgi:trimeric autotransporter adhesin
MKPPERMLPRLKRRRAGGKSSRNQKALVAALLAAGVGFGTAVKSEAAATSNSYAAGILGTNSSNSDCISSADGAQVSTGTDCTSGSTAQEAGIVSYDGNGNPGAYFTVTDPNTVHVGAGGVDQLKITNSGLFVLNTLNMGGNKITNVAAGAVSASSTDVVNGAQLFGITNGSTVVNSAYVKVTGLNNGTDNASAPNMGSIAIGSNSAVAAGSGGDQIAIGDKAKAGSAGVAGAIAIGGFTSALSDAVAIGYGATATNTHSSALGAWSTATGLNSVALGGYSVAARDNTVSVGSSGSERQIVNVKAGTQGTDAVNYGQLQAAGLKVDTSGNAINSFVAYDDTTQSKAKLGGATGTTLTNMAAGVVSLSSTDAVNGSQLYTTNQSVAQNAVAIAQNTSDISTNASNIAQNTSDIATNAAKRHEPRYARHDGRELGVRFDHPDQQRSAGSRAAGSDHGCGDSCQ